MLEVSIDELNQKLATGYQQYEYRLFFVFFVHSTNLAF